MAKKVSVIVCAYNAEKDLAECLRSLQAQDYGTRELIVVDDASTDATGEVLKRFAGQGTSTLMTVTNQRNLGVAGSRNVGLKLASGEIVAFTDADCIADPHWISELVKGYGEEDVQAVGGRIADKKTKNIWELVDKRHNFVAAAEGLVSYIQGCNMSFDARVLKEYAFNDEIKYGYEETLLCEQLTSDGHKIYYRPQAAVHHKPRNSFASLWKLKFRRGLSSVWYRKKKDVLFIYLRHLILILSILCVPLAFLHRFWLWIAGVLFLAFAFSLLRDEIIFRTKSNAEILLTFPFLVLIEMAHFWGSLAGVIKFRIMGSQAGE